MLFPRLVLQPGSLPDADRLLCRPLVGPVLGRDPRLPLVAVAHAFEAGLFRLFTREGTPVALEAVVSQARRTLALTPLSWIVHDSGGGFFHPRPRMLRAAGDPRIPFEVMCTDGGGVDDLSTAALLHPPALKQAADGLGASSLLAVAPKRGCLLVSAGSELDEPAILRMQNLAEDLAERAGRHFLSTAVFFVRDGEVVGARTGSDSHPIARGGDLLFGATA
jgi:hypothetical protein